MYLLLIFCIIILFIITYKILKKDLLSPSNINNDLKNEIVIIGGNHYNMLGVLRSLGEKKIKSNIIVTDKKRFAYVTKSKYVKSYYQTVEDEEKIKNILLNNFINQKQKAILIPTSDFAALFIDKNLNELQKYFIVPNINNIQGQVEKIMDKYYQYELAKKNNIKMAKSFSLNLKNKIELKNIPFPCIIKPLISALGSKKDIKICHNKNEFQKAINEFKGKKYQDVMIQEYIDYDYECELIGCANDNHIIIPGITTKIWIYPLKSGSTSFGKIDSLKNFNFKINKIEKLIKSLNFTGIFDLEVFVKGNDMYLNEINFRNGGHSYAYTYDDVYIVYLWLLLVLNKDISKEVKQVNNSFYFNVELIEIKHLTHHNISFKTWYQDMKRTNISLFYNKNDVRPYIYKFFMQLVIDYLKPKINNFVGKGRFFNEKKIYKFRFN